MTAGRLALAALAATLLACGVRSPPRPPDHGHRGVVEPAPATTTTRSCPDPAGRCP